MAAIVRRPSSEMEKFLKATRSGRLLGSVERHLTSRAPEVRPWKTLHPSAICKDWCSRAAYFAITSDTPPSPARIGRRTQSIYDEGHLIHAKWQRYFTEMDVLYGNWHCLICSHEWWNISPSCCSYCGSKLFRYAEVPLHNDDWLVAGHADGWIKGIGPDALIEIKSVGTGTVRFEAPNMFERHDGNLEEIWKNLKRPFSSHLKQAQLYLRVLNETLPEAPQEVVFLYECKANQDAKEFVVGYDTSVTDAIVEQAKTVKQHIEAGTPPECPTGGCSECRAYRGKV